MFERASERAQIRKHREANGIDVGCRHAGEIEKGKCVRKTIVECKRTEESFKVSLADCEKRCKYKEPAGKGRISVVIPIIDEDPKEVATTLRTIKDGTKGDVEMILIDDSSKIPLDYATFRTKGRMGATRARQLGCERATGEFVAVLDSHMKIGKGNLRELARVAEKTGGIAYCGCNSHIVCEMRNVGELPLAKWSKPGRFQLQPTTSMMGACYVMQRSVLEFMGGWVGLPGYLGWQELSQTINAWKHGIPITCHTGISNWHHFRLTASAPVPYDRYILNRAAMHRMLFGDECWNEVWKPRLLKPPKNVRRIPALLMKEAEAPWILEYGEKLRSNMVKSDEDFMEYFATLKKQDK